MNTFINKPFSAVVMTVDQSIQGVSVPLSCKYPTITVGLSLPVMLTANASTKTVIDPLTRGIALTPSGVKKLT